MRRLNARSSLQMKKKQKVKTAAHTVIENITQVISQRTIRGIKRRQGSYLVENVWVARRTLKKRKKICHQLPSTENVTMKAIMNVK